MDCIWSFIFNSDYFINCYIFNTSKLVYFNTSTSSHGMQLKILDTPLVWKVNIQGTPLVYFPAWNLIPEGHKDVCPFRGWKHLSSPSKQKRRGDGLILTGKVQVWLEHSLPTE